MLVPSRSFPQAPRGRRIRHRIVDLLMQSRITCKAEYLEVTGKRLCSRVDELSPSDVEDGLLSGGNTSKVVFKTDKRTRPDQRGFRMLVDGI